MLCNCSDVCHSSHASTTWPHWGGNSWPVSESKATFLSISAPSKPPLASAQHDISSTLPHSSKHHSGLRYWRTSTLKRGLVGFRIQPWPPVAVPCSRTSYFTSWSTGLCLPELLGLISIVSPRAENQANQKALRGGTKIVYLLILLGTVWQEAPWSGNTVLCDGPLLLPNQSTLVVYLITSLAMGSFNVKIKS